MKSLDRLTAKIDRKNLVIDHIETGRRVKEARQKAGVKQSVLAETMGIGHSHLCYLEKGRRNWSMKLFTDAKEALIRLAQPAT